MKKILIFISCFLAAATILVAAPCMTNKELYAEITLGFLTGQGGTSFLCDQIMQNYNKNWNHDLMKMNKRFFKKFEPELRVIAKWREGFYKRRFGQNWSYEMGKSQKKNAKLILSSTVVNKNVCTQFTGVMIVRLKSNWTYIKNQIDNIYARQRVLVPRCK